MRELALALRSLTKDKSFTIATVLTLALCIGANAALFGVVYSVVLKPLPVPEPGRLVLVYNSYPKAGADRGGSGVPDFIDRVARMTTLDAICLVRNSNRATGEPGRPERVRVMGVTPSFFRVARVRAELGRTFTEDEGEIGHEDKVVLAHAYWQERYAGDPGVVGRQLRLDGRSFTIVGVMGPGFSLVDEEARLYVPLAFTAEQKSDDARHSNSWTSIGRLRDGATLAQAQAQVDLINAADLERFPAFKAVLVNAGFHTVVTPYQDDLVRDVKSRLFLLWGGTLLVLVIGCVNVVNLALVRAHARTRDLAMRLALGAGRFAIARHLLAESLLLTGLSGLAGLLLGWGALRLLGSLDLSRVPRGAQIGMDPVSVAFTLGLAALVGVAVGLFPVVQTFGLRLAAVLHEGGRGGSGGRRAQLVRRALVVTQVAVALVLMMGTGLLLASFRQVLAIAPGFDPDRVLTAVVSLRAERYQTDAAAVAFAEEALRRVRAIPGVESASLTTDIPLGNMHSDSVIFAEGYQMQPGESVISPNQIAASDGYFETMRIPLRRGRMFDARDRADAPRAVIVDERLARRFWPNQDPVGRRMYTPNSPGEVNGPTASTRWLTVVGVVGEVKQEGLVPERAPVGAYYFPLAQEGRRTMAFVIRASREPATLAPELRSAIGGLDPELPVYSVKTMQQMIDESLLTRKWPMMLSLGFGVVALLLSAVGIYGVLAYLVTQRTKEIGIRVALGGAPRRIFDLVLKEGLLLLGIGCAAGLVGLVALRRVLESQLYGVAPGDPAVLASATALLGVVAIVACAIPARRATRIDPVLALNRE